MPSFEESGLRVTLPDEGSFRFSACRAYQGILRAAGVGDGFRLVVQRVDHEKAIEKGWPITVL